jgi:NTP pyrophosphatase (non-canonical NTP hydrolase)
LSQSGQSAKESISKRFSLSIYLLKEGDRLTPAGVKLLESYLPEIQALEASSQEQGQDALRDWLADCRLVTDGHIRRMGGKVFEGNALYTPPVAPSFWLPDGAHWTMADQIAHAHSEVSEVFQAIRHGENRERIKEEIADSVYSAITMFHIYGCTDEEIEETLGSVMWKIAKRADVHSEIKTFKLKAADSHDAERDKRA